MSDDDRSGLCHNCGSHVGRGECTNATCPLSHREYPPITPDDQIPCPSPPGNDAGSLRAAMLARVADMVRSAKLAAKAPAPPITDPAWLEADGWAQVASLFVLAEAWLVEHWSEHDPDALKQASAAISGALDWSAETSQPSHATLTQRRTEPLHQRKCEAFDCRVIFRFDSPPPDAISFNCALHGGWISLSPGTQTEPTHG